MKKFEKKRLKNHSIVMVCGCCCFCDWFGLRSVCAFLHRKKSAGSRKSHAVAKMSHVQVDEVLIDDRILNIFVEDCSGFFWTSHRKCSDTVIASSWKPCTFCDFCMSHIQWFECLCLATRFGTAGVHFLFHGRIAACPQRRSKGVSLFA